MALWLSHFSSSASKDKNGNIKQLPYKAPYWCLVKLDVLCLFQRTNSILSIVIILYVLQKNSFWECFPIINASVPIWILLSGQRFADFSKILPFSWTILPFQPFILGINFQMSGKSWGLILPVKLSSLFNGSLLCFFPSIRDRSTRDW